jgi:hypothetical protein
MTALTIFTKRTRNQINFPKQQAMRTWNQR